jgi:hypothetical protein
VRVVEAREDVDEAELEELFVDALDGEVGGSVDPFSGDAIDNSESRFEPFINPRGLKAMIMRWDSRLVRRRSGFGASDAILSSRFSLIP